MPTLYFHYKFGHHILKNLDSKNKKLITDNIKYYDMFNQGFDNLYYYPFKWNYYRKFGVRCHKKNLDNFFESLFSYIKTNNLNNNALAISLVSGFINHLVLDSLFHPYINYQVKNLKIPHCKIEYLFDFYIYNLEYSTKWPNKIYKTLIPKVKFSNSLNELLDEVFYNTYQEDNISKVFKKSHNFSYYLYRYLISDVHGIKAFLYKFIDLLTPKKDIKFSETTFYNKGFTKELLNREKNNWHHPRNKKEIYNYSLDELYDISFSIALKLNKLALEILSNQKDIQEFTNLIKFLDIKNTLKFL